MFSEQAAPTAQGLLAPPSTEASTFARVPVSAYTDCSQPFRLGERSFSHQYAHIYAVRLIKMRPILEERARQKWGELVWGVAPLPWEKRTKLCGRCGTCWKLLGDFSAVPKLMHTLGV